MAFGLKNSKDLPVHMPRSNSRISPVYSQLIQRRERGDKLKAILLDPDKFDPLRVTTFLEQLTIKPDLLLVGGSTVPDGKTEKVVTALKIHSPLPVLIFPGSVNQISLKADAILFLSLISGDNPEYLIGQQVKAAGMLRDSEIEVIPVGYILVDRRNHSSVARVTNTRPMNKDDINTIVDTALAAQLMGKWMIYLEAGSGASYAISPEIIRAVRKEVSIPLIVGGGIRTEAQLKEAHQAGADMVVMGNVFEKKRP